MNKHLTTFLPQSFATLLLAASSPGAHAQTYSIGWHQVAGGGGTSTNSQFALTGTIGQPDASSPMSGGGWSVTGGFWNLINLVTTPGLPNLIIVPSGLNSVKLLWPDPAGNSCTLQQNGNVAVPNGWITTGFSITHASGTNSVIITPPLGNLFFRLKQ